MESLTNGLFPGCLECRTRRVICDKAEPECFKCRKKGIKCSGQGIECRFSPYMRKKSTAAKVKASTTAVIEGEGYSETAAADGASQPSTSTDTVDMPTRTTNSRKYLWVDPEPIPGRSPKTTPVAALVVPKIEEDLDSSALADTPAHWTSASSSSPTSSETDEALYQDVKGKHIMPLILKPKSEDSLVARRPLVKRKLWPYGPGTTIQSISSDSRFFFDHCT